VGAHERRGPRICSTWWLNETRGIVEELSRRGQFECGSSPREDLWTPREEESDQELKNGENDKMIALDVRGLELWGTKIQFPYEYSGFEPMGLLSQNHLQIVHLLLNVCEFFDYYVEDSKGRQFRFRFFHTRRNYEFACQLSTAAATPRAR
jgi:hypothetical protein